jgi:hypothetical protein
MTFLEELTAHKGGLVCLKSELFWYGGRGWDGTRGRVCLLMDSAARSAAAAGPRIAAAAVTDATARSRGPRADYSTLLLIDGCPHWVWVSSDDLELL